MKVKQFTREEAIKFAESGKWKGMSDDALFRFQLYQNKLCVDFSEFHRCAEAVLGRPVWTHEFGNIDNIRDEYVGKKAKPDMEEIIGLIPPEKLIIVVR